MKTYNSLISVLLVIASCSCQVQEEMHETQDRIMSFYATGESKTRTHIREGQYSWFPSISWDPADEINIFCGNGGGRFVSNNTESTDSRVEFIGTLKNVTDRGDNPFWAVYPYSEDYIFDGKSVLLSLPTAQEAVVGNVKRGLMISMARTYYTDLNLMNERELYFYNLCGVICIPVYEDGIKRIVFRGNNNEPIAGRVFASLNDEGIPFISKYENPSCEITLLAPNNGSFDRNNKYHIVCFPGEFDKGYTIEFYKDELVSMKKITTPVKLHRAGYVDLQDLYSGGIIYSVEDKGVNYSLEYKYNSSIDSTSYWVMINDKLFEVPEKFHAGTKESPTEAGPAIAIDTEKEIVYFAKSNVIYRISSSSYDKIDQDFNLYPYFRMNKDNNLLELHSYAMNYWNNNEVYHSFSVKFSNKNWYNHYWMRPNDDGQITDYESSGFNKKKLSDIILLFQEKGISDYPSSMTAIDLGLSVKWASCNLGSNSPEIIGDYYAWGEITPKNVFTEDNYQYSGSLASGYSKYNKDDNKFYLDSEDDAAHVRLGGDWRIPTPEEWRELVQKCTWERAFLNGVAGLYGTSIINGNHIFLPVDYSVVDDVWAPWLSSVGATYCSSQVAEGGYPWCDWMMTSAFFFNLIEQYSIGGNDYFPEGRDYLHFNQYERFLGFAIRPIYSHIDVEEIFLDKDIVELAPGESVTLNVTVNPSNATNKDVIWASSDESVATVSQSGVVTCVAPGKAIIKVTSEDNGLSDTCVVNPYYCKTPEIVDLGLSVKWASFNLGATSPDETGLYYAWGETKPKDEYNEHNYKWREDTGLSCLTKYCLNPDSGFNGFFDNKEVLDPEDDAARVNLGGKWRMPNREEIEELKENCDISADKLNDIDVLSVTSRINGNSFYFPYNGGSYWASTIVSENNYFAYSLPIYNRSWVYMNLSQSHREYGLLIRPVFDDSKGNEGITPGGDINM